ncbi:hypothetical protein BOTBODRAFT_139111 [Botryobasidium botryosum FD-172 SS1]|uniref:Cytochrome b5 heme-binding domain-containing protein n=1 Tax=Botryobasidium botryosum (strain FD-172 SS1) TaxID=930990 RepID=A0A067LYC1_BOTB1|nr:hypothetical protein BOTBODRAFT_139111 [Botryobasidium botryosum FD-172 SS1]
MSSDASKTTFTLEQLKLHSQSDDCYLLLHGKVYNVTEFLDEHPGGDEVILAETGKDSTEAFEDVGHSDEARELLEKMFVGNFEGTVTDDKPGTKVLTPNGPVPVEEVKAKAKEAASSGSSISYFLPITFFVGYLAWRYFQ